MGAGRWLIAIGLLGLTVGVLIRAGPADRAVERSGDSLSCRTLLRENPVRDRDRRPIPGSPRNVLEFLVGGDLEMVERVAPARVLSLSIAEAINLFWRPS